jgi:hypothetical protein
MPGMQSVTVRRAVEYRAAEGAALTLDLYAPPAAKGAARPAVVLVVGYPDPGFEAMLGCKWKEMESSVGWAHLLGASGIVAITYTNRDPAADLDALLEHVRRNGESLGIDPARIGLWASSGNVPLALSLLMQRRASCAALLYGFTLDLEGSTVIADAARTFGFANPTAGKSVEDLPRDVPLFVARAGRDETPGLNVSLDRFLGHALAANLPIAFANHPEGPHAFELWHDSETTREVVRQILAFLRSHLRA